MTDQSTTSEADDPSDEETLDHPDSLMHRVRHALEAERSGARSGAGEVPPRDSGGDTQQDDSDVVATGTPSASGTRTEIDDEGTLAADSHLLDQLRAEARRPTTLVPATDEDATVVRGTPPPQMSGRTQTAPATKSSRERPRHRQRTHDTAGETGDAGRRSRIFERKRRRAFSALALTALVAGLGALLLLLGRGRPVSTQDPAAAPDLTTQDVQHSGTPRSSATTLGGDEAEDAENAAPSESAGASTSAKATGRISIAVGERHACRLRTDGTATCWGNNAQGRANPPEGTFTTISAGAHHTCGLRTNGAATCWGNNAFGQANPPSGTFTTISAGTEHTCGLRTNGTTACWGNNHDGRIEPPFYTFTTISAGTEHTCGLRTNGAATCWGGNLWGQANRPGVTLTEIAAGASFTCGLNADGIATCWGRDVSGQADPPSGTFTAISAGSAHACGLRTDGTAACWGYNGSGQADPPSGTFTAISAGGTYTCGLRTDGNAQCWGSLTRHNEDSAVDLATITAPGRQTT